jgi:hypothetical protein
LFLLCASKNDEVVEYALSRTISPLMVAEYQLKLPDKEVLRKKLRELADLPNSGLPQEADPFQENK